MMAEAGMSERSLTLTLDLPVAQATPSPPLPDFDPKKPFAFSALQALSIELKADLREPKWDLLAFTGGPVGCVDWCPRRFGGTAFVAVGANPPRVAKTRGGVLLSGPCAIQIWALAESIAQGNNAAGAVQRAPARLLLATTLAHEGGKTWAVKWEPGEGVAEVEDGRVKLGRLAAALGDGRVAVVDVSLPEADCLAPASLSQAQGRRAEAEVVSECVMPTDAATLFSGVDPSVGPDVASCIDWANVNAGSDDRAGREGGNARKGGVSRSVLAVGTFGGCCHLFAWEGGQGEGAGTDEARGAGASEAGTSGADAGAGHARAPRLRRVATLPGKERPVASVEIVGTKREWGWGVDVDEGVAVGGERDLGGAGNGAGAGVPRPRAGNAWVADVTVCVCAGTGGMEVWEAGDPFLPRLVVGEGRMRITAGALVRKPFLCAAVCRAAWGLRLHPLNPRIVASPDFYLGKCPRSHLYEPGSMGALMAVDVAGGTSLVATAGEDGEVVALDAYEAMRPDKKRKSRDYKGARVVASFYVSGRHVAVGSVGRGLGLTTGIKRQAGGKAQAGADAVALLPVDDCCVSVVRWGPGSATAPRVRWLAVGCGSGLLRVLEVGVPDSAVW